MVVVPEVRDDPDAFIEALSDAGYFESSVITPEDRQRSAQFQGNRTREALKTSSLDMESYLRALEMELLWRRFEIRDGIGEFELNLGLDEMAIIAPPSGAVAVDNASDAAALLLKFESLGSSCEFGIVQRMAGIEPLGLLRWANITPIRLIEMLNANLAGVGDPASVSVTLGKFGEWRMRDPRYFGMHTFIHAGQMTEQEVQKACERRSRFLADKLRRDLADPQKIFVYKPFTEVFEPDKAEGIFDALRCRGPARLLCVHKRGAIPEGGRVHKLREGLLIAAMPELSDDPLEAVKRLGVWHAICREAIALFAPARL